MKKMWFLLSLLLSMTLVMPPVFALAPQSRFPRKVNFAEEWKRLKEDAQIKRLGSTIMEEWQDIRKTQEPTHSLSGFMANRMVSEWISGIRSVKFEPTLYPLMPDCFYLKGVVLEGPLKGKECCLRFSIFKDNTGVEKGSIALLDPFQLREDLLLWLGPHLMPEKLGQAIMEYKIRKVEVLRERRPPLEEQQALSHLANEVFNSHYLGLQDPAQREASKKSWALFMLETALEDLSLEVKTAVCFLHGIMMSGENMSAYVQSLFPVALVDNLGLRYVLEANETSSYQHMKAEDKYYFLHIILSLSGLSPGAMQSERALVNQLMLESPWANAIFLPGVPWMRQEDPAEKLEEKFLTQLCARELDSEDLARLADPYFLEGYKQFFLNPYFRALSTDEKLSVLVSRICDDLQYVKTLSKAFKEQGNIPPIRSMRIVANVEPPSARVDARIREFRKTVENSKIFVHDANSCIHTMTMAARMLEEELNPMENPALGPIKSALSGFLTAAQTFHDTMGGKSADDRSSLSYWNNRRPANAVEAALLTVEIQSKLILLRNQINIIEIAYEHLRPLMELGRDAYAGMNPLWWEKVKLVPERMQTARNIWARLFNEDGSVAEKEPEKNYHNLAELISPDQIKKKYSEYLNGIDVILDVGPGVDQKQAQALLSDELFMNSVLSQPIRNSGQAMGGDNEEKDGPSKPGTLGSITIRLRIDEGCNWVYVEVEDTGPGIDRAIMSKIFLPAFSSGKEKKVSKGTGVGLDTARAVVHQYGGRIWAESAQGGEEKGAKLTIALPTRKAIEERISVGQRKDLIWAAQTAILDLLRLKGDGHSDFVRTFGDQMVRQALEQNLQQLMLSGTLLPSAPPSENVPREGEKSVGRGGVKVVIMDNAILNTQGIVDKRSTDTQSQVLFSEPGGIRKLPPELYLRKLVVGKDAAGAGIDVRENIAWNLNRIADRLSRTLGLTKAVSDLKVAVLCQDRHEELVRDMIKAGVRICHPDHTPPQGFLEQDQFWAEERKQILEDFEGFWNAVKRRVRENEKDMRFGNVVFLARKDVEAVHGLHAGTLDLIAGADGTEEGLMCAAWTEIYGGEMSAQLASKKKLGDKVLGSDVQTNFGNFDKEERILAAKPEYGFVSRQEFKKDPTRNTCPIDQVFGAADLVNSAQALFVATAITDSSWVEGLKGIEVDPATGDKKVCMLVAEKGGLVRIVEVVYEGDYEEMREKIAKARDLQQEMDLRQQFAQKLVQDGLHAQAIYVLEEWMAQWEEVTISRSYSAVWHAVKGLNLLTNKVGREEDAFKEFSESLEMDPSDPLSIGPIHEKMAEKPSIEEVTTTQYRFVLEKGSGEMFIELFDSSGDHYRIPLSANIIDGAGNKIQYVLDKKRLRKPKTFEEHAGIKAYTEFYIPFKSSTPGVPDMELRFTFYKDRFSLEMDLTNQMDEDFVLGEMQLLCADAMVLGKNKEEMIFDNPGKNSDIGVWTHLSTRLSLALRISGRTRIEQTEENSGVIAVEKFNNEEGKNKIKANTCIRSSRLQVLVSQDFLNAVPHYALLKTMCRFLGEKLAAKYLKKMSSTLPEHQQRALTTAAMISEPSVSWFKSVESIPRGYDIAKGLESALSNPEWKPVAVDAEAEKKPNIAYVDLGPDQGRLVAVFNFKNEAKAMDLSFAEVGLLDPRNPGKEYYVMDLWQGDDLGGDLGTRIKGNYNFFKGDQKDERVPPFGVKFLWIRPVDQRLPAPEPQSVDLLIDDQAEPATSL